MEMQPDRSEVSSRENLSEAINRNDAPRISGLLRTKGSPLSPQRSPGLDTTNHAIPHISPSWLSYGPGPVLDQVPSRSPAVHTKIAPASSASYDEHRLPKDTNSSAFDPRRSDAAFYMESLKFDIFQDVASRMSHMSSELEVTFDLKWNGVLDFLSDQLEEWQDISSMLVLVGSQRHAIATTCAKYMQFCWPQANSGLLLSLLEELRRSKLKGFPERDYLDFRLSGPRILGDASDSLQLEDVSLPMASNAFHQVYYSKSVRLEGLCLFHRRGIYLRVVNTAQTGGEWLDSLTCLVQQLAWVTATFRPRSEIGSVIKEPLLSDIGFHLYQRSFLRIHLEDLSGGPSLAGFTWVKDQPCWHHLFPQATISHGFPIPGRQGEQHGLEIPFEAMVILAKVDCFTGYGGGTILKGKSTILVPVAGNSTSVQWHLIHANESDKVRHRRWWSKSKRRGTLKHDIINDLGVKVLSGHLDEKVAIKRNFLGYYCKPATVYLGTAGSNYDSASQSGARRRGNYIEVAREASFTVGFSRIVNASVSGRLTFKKSDAVHVNQGMEIFDDAVRRSSKTALVLHDVRGKQSWLVPEICAVLHIAHAWASKQILDARDIESRLPRIGHGYHCGLDACRSILAGRDSVLRDRPDNKITTESLITGILQHLENRKDAVYSSKGIFEDSYLLGWEFDDIAENRRKAFIKEDPFKSTVSGDWHRLPFEESDVIVLFCGVLADPIRPRLEPPHWPSTKAQLVGRSTLIATVESISHLAELAGGDISRGKLTDRLYLKSQTHSPKLKISWKTLIGSEKRHRSEKEQDLDDQHCLYHVSSSAPKPVEKIHPDAAILIGPAVIRKEKPLQCSSRNGLEGIREQRSS